MSWSLTIPKNMPADQAREELKAQQYVPDSVKQYIDEGIKSSTGSTF